MFDRLENLLAHSTHNMLNTNIYISVKRERERERCCVSTYLCAVEESVMDQERERDRER